MNNSIGIIDYGMGNLRSVEKALEYLNYEVFVSSDIKKLEKADKLILPGVGAFKDAIDTMKNTGLDVFVKNFANTDKPLLGICLGMQLFFESSEEYGFHKGLGILKGKICKLSVGEKIPHMGWNSLDIKMEGPLFCGLPKEPYVYFVHSYYLSTEEPIVSATCFYGQEIQVAAQNGNIFALQFHPEKSGDIGLKILDNFGRL